MISISTPVFDLSGHVILAHTEESDVHQQQRRVVRTKTLDGEVDITDLGFAHGDSTFRLVSKGVTKAVYDAIVYLHKNYQQLIISTDNGCYLGAISYVSLSSGNLLLTYLVKEKLTLEV